MNFYSLLKLSAKINQTKLNQVAKNYSFNRMYETRVSQSTPYDTNEDIIKRKKAIQQRKKEQIMPTMIKIIENTRNSLIQNIGLDNVNGDWILNQINNGASEIEDIPQLKMVISQFNKIKPKLQKRDLNQYYHYDQLKTAVDSVLGSVGKTVNPKLLQDHFTFINKVGEYSLYKANDIQGVKEIGQISGSWCTRGSYQDCAAQQYFEDGIYEILKGDQLFAQASGSLDQVMNLNNNKITQFDQNLKLLLKSIKTGFFNYIYKIDPQYKLTQQQLNDPEIYNSILQMIIIYILNGDQKKYNKLNNKCGNIFNIQNIVKNPQMMKKVKFTAISSFVRGDNRFDKINGIFNGLFSEINEDEQAKKIGKEQAFNQLSQISSFNQSYFLELDNKFNNIFSNDKQVLSQAIKKMVEGINKDEIRLISNVNKAFNKKLINDNNIINLAKNKFITLLSEDYLVLCRDLDFVFQRQLTKFPQVLLKAKEKAVQYMETPFTNRFQNLKHLFPYVLVGDLYIYNSAKKIIIQSMSQGYTSVFSKLNKAFNGRFSKDQDLIDRFSKTNPKLFAQQSVLANNFYKKLKLSQINIQGIQSYGAKLIDHKSELGYDLMLTTMPKLPSEFNFPKYQIGIQLKGKDFTNPNQQLQKKKLQPQNMPPRDQFVKFITQTLNQWLNKYGDLIFNSFNPQNTRKYASILSSLGFNLEKKNMYGNYFYIIKK